MVTLWLEVTMIEEFQMSSESRQSLIFEALTLHMQSFSHVIIGWRGEFC